jgi:DNA modification methylase
MTVIQGDCLDVLRTLPDASVHCCVTSPPYWGLRDYGHDGQIGLEATPEAYVARMVEVFREVRRVLRDDGTCWVNLGDSYYAGGWECRRVNAVGNGSMPPESRKSGIASKIDGLKVKDLVGIPWRVAFALQADGWWLRQDIIWHKPNPMPESVRDRCTKAHEYVFLLTKSDKYFYDADAVSEKAAHEGRVQTGYRRPNKQAMSVGPMARGAEGFNHQFAQPDRVWCDGKTRNRRSVWKITAKPYRGAHFATMPPDLVEPCIKAGTSEHGCCLKCGAQHERVTKRTKLTRERPNDYTKRTGEAGTGNSCANSVAGVSVETLGWAPTCKCDAGITPCVVLDPFAGSGTTLAVATELGRCGVGIELNPDYVRLADERIAKAKAKAPLFV